MIIGLDFDGTINNMLDTWVAWLNKNHGMSVDASMITDWSLENTFSNLSIKELFEPVDTPEFWDEVTIKPGAAEVIKKLIADGHAIYVVTSSHYKTLSYKFKNCLFAHLPFLTKENVIVTFDKSLIRCDVLLDDAEHNLVNFPGIGVVFDAPYNKCCSADYRVSSWNEFYELITLINKEAAR